MSNDDYGNYPQSLTELKSEKSKSAKDWTPRDVLIAALREIDGGVKNPLACVVIFREESATNFYVSSPNTVTTFGMMRQTELQIFNGINNS